MPTSEDLERIRELCLELEADATARRQRWMEERSEGLGVTPGTAEGEVELSPDDPCDFVPDTSILGQDTNPKQLAATRDKKPPLHLLEYVADCEIAAALSHGAEKYGRKNFHETPILANVYGGAIRRHIGQWLNEEDLDSDSGLSHLAHIGANIHVLFAAMAAGTFVDDRAPEQQSEVQKRLSDASNRSRP